MGKVDLLLTRLEKMGGESMIVATRHPIQFLIAGELKALSTTAMGDTDVVALLGEVIPREQRASLARPGRTELTHATASGRQVQLTIERTSGGIGARWDLLADPAAGEATVVDGEEPAAAEVDMSLPDSDGEMEIEHPGGDVHAAAAGADAPAESARDFDFDAGGDDGDFSLDIDIPTIDDPPAEAAAPARAAAAPAPAAAKPAPAARPTPSAAAKPAPAARSTPSAATAPARAPAAPTPAAAAARPAPSGGSTQRLVSLLRGLLEIGGSDLHVSAGSPPRMRIHGRLAPLEDGPVTAEEAAAMADALLDAHQRERLAEEHSIDFAFDLSDVGRFRASIVRQRRGTGLVFRAIPSQIPTIESLGLPASVAGLTEYPNGLVLVTGPAGAGKSTTLAAILDRINETWHDHIITVEDPIEFVHPAKECLVNQREVGTHVRSFAEALKSALREDPDVLLVGELRDLETIQLAITAAETGHLVLGTLHTVDAAKTIDRLIDVFPGSQKAQIRGMVSESLRGVVSQQLVPAADGNGRVAAYEVLVADRPIANLIRESKTFQIGNAIRLGKNKGMISMDDALAELVAKGRITAEAALAHSEAPDALKKQLEASARRAAVPATAPAAAPSAAGKRVPDARR